MNFCAVTSSKGKQLPKGAIKTVIVPICVVIVMLVSLNPFNGMAQWPCAAPPIEVDEIELSISVLLDTAIHCVISGCCEEQAIEIVQKIDMNGLGAMDKAKYLLLEVALNLVDSKAKEIHLHRSLQLLPPQDRATIAEKELLLWNYSELNRYYLVPINADSLGHYWQQIEQLLNENVGNKALQAKAAVTLTNHYSILGKTEQALYWAYSTLKLSKNSPPKFEATAYVNIAYLFYEMSNPDSAYYYANKAYAVAAVENGSPTMATRAARVMGFIAHDGGDMVDYERICKMALASAIKTNAPNVIAAHYQQYANALFHTDNYGKAIKMAEEGLEQDGSELSVIYELYRVLTVAAEKLNNHQLALEYHKRLYQYQDSLNSRQHEETLAELNKRYALEKKDSEIALLRTQRSEAELQAKWWGLVSLAAVLTILIFSGLIVIWSMRKKQKVQYKLYEHQRQLDAQVMKATLDERERISLILHDTVASSLSGMTYMAQYLVMLENEPKKQVELKAMSKQLDRLYQQVRNLSHELMPFQPSEKNDFSKQLSEFIELRAKQLQNQELTWFLDHEEQLNNFSDENRLLVFAFIQESLHNAIRHSKAEQISIESWVNPQQLGIRVSDNGIGISGKVNGIGLKGMRLRAEKEGAEIRITEPTGGGTAIELVFNLDNLHQT